MALKDRIRAVARERLGVDVVDVDEVKRLRESAEEFAIFKDEAEDLAYTALRYVAGRPSEMRPEARRRLAQRSRIALMQDPLAGAEAELLANFSLGKGVQVPNAPDEDVADVIREHWTDTNNEQKVYGFAAQRHRSNELVAQANLFPTGFVGGGQVTMGFLDADRVIDIVCDPNDEEFPLFYVVEERAPVEWDYSKHQPKIKNQTAKAKVKYWPHWRNVEDLDRRRAKQGLPPVEKPPEHLIGKGLVEHIAVNRIGRSLFGTPRWARTLRFMSAMNDLTEAHVGMAQAASMFVARRAMIGSPETIQRQANAVLSQTGDIGAARFGAGRDRAVHGEMPPNPGSFLEENESSKLESLNLNSGSGQMAQTATIVRAPIAAASGFGQHYLGDSSTANLATATSLELPTTMTIQAWQRVLEGLMRFGTDMALEAAFRIGRLDAAVKRKEDEENDDGETEWEESDTPVAELCLREYADRREIEGRTGRSFDYTLATPYPGRRNLPDVQGFVVGLMQVFDPERKNVEFIRDLMLWAASEGMMLHEPQEAVDRWMPIEAADAIVRQAEATSQQQLAGAAGGVGPDGEPLIPTDGGVPGGDPAQGSGASGEIPAGAKGLFELAAGLSEEEAAIFEQFILQPVRESLNLPEPANGSS